MEFGLVIKTETHFADAESHINRNKIDLSKGWITCLAQESYDRIFLGSYLQWGINSTSGARRFVKRQKTKIPKEHM